MIQSTVDLNSKAFLKETIPVKKLIVGYKNQFDIDIKNYLKNVSEVKIFECENTGYQFFFPYHIDGDSCFYEKLQKFDWYYMPWKWEHECSKKILLGNEKVLEIGSGGLGFVENLAKSGFDITGLELNEDSIEKASKLGLKVLNESIQIHAVHNFENYDVVCSYQVLEHISEVSSFIKAQIDCLKKGGKLIIAVPNNNSFIKYSKGGLLNFPPHHMGLWNERSLRNLVNVFDVKVDKVLYEPLQKYHLDWFIQSTINEIIYRSKFLKWIFNFFKLRKLYVRIVNKIRIKIKGHTIMIIYTKV
ncbi:class I SAM-dependent methyltransferase [Flavobacterium hiemivividum]|nr:class I SAM-dependent methyltransferase [Flavobacterium hiemivividum]